VTANEKISKVRFAPYAFTEHGVLMLHIENNDYKFSEYDKAIRQILQALNNLIEKPKESKRIGFNAN